MLCAPDLFPRFDDDYQGSLDANTRIRPHADVVARRVGDETVLVQLGRNEIFSLNATGSRLWELVANGSTLGEAQERLLAEFSNT